MNNEKEINKVSSLKFVTKVTIYHIFTYIICGMIFSTLFNYSELYAFENMAYFMHPVDSINTLIGPFCQIFRGIIFGLVLLLLRDFINSDKGFLKLYVLILVFGIINTPGPAPSSIEGIIYTQLPWQCHVFGAPEILVQTFIFSLLVSSIDKKKMTIPVNVKKSLIATLLCVIFYSVGGIILAAILKVEVQSEATSIASYLTLLITGLLCFGMTFLYLLKKEKKPVVSGITYYGLLYAICAVYPFIINTITDSPYKSPLGLIISALPVIAVALYIRKK